MSTISFSSIWRSRRMVAIVVPALIILATVTTVFAATLLQISSDTYTNPDSQHKTQVEPDTFAAGSTIVMATQTGRFFDGGASNIAFATSVDGGATWTTGNLPGITKIR
jgi:hypothetical protein